MGVGHCKWEKNIMLVKGLIAVFGVVVMLMNETKTVGKIVKVATFLLVSIFISSPSSSYKLCKWFIHCLVNICWIGGEGLLALRDYARTPQIQGTAEPVGWVHPLLRLGKFEKTYNQTPESLPPGTLAANWQSRGEGHFTFHYSEESCCFDHSNIGL